LEFCNYDVQGEAFSVGSIRGHRIYGVCNENNSRAQWDLKACDPIRVTLTIPSLMVVPNRILYEAVKFSDDSN
jgi:hypothetical protein